MHTSIGTHIKVAEHQFKSNYSLCGYFVASYKPTILEYLKLLVLSMVAADPVAGSYSELPSHTMTTYTSSCPTSEFNKNR